MAKSERLREEIRTTLVLGVNEVYWGNKEFKEEVGELDCWSRITWHDDERGSEQVNEQDSKRPNCIGRLGGG